MFTSFSIALAKTDTQQSCLIDIPGVDWVGEPSPNDWGSTLSKDKITIFVRHQGPGLDKWVQPKDKGCIVVTLPDNKASSSDLDRMLQPVLRKSFSQSKTDVHIVIDKNITLSRHLLPFQATGEDTWAAKLTDYMTTYLPHKFNAVLAEHSRGTVTNEYISNFNRFSRIIISSPRGDDALRFVNSHTNLPPIDIIRGISDAPSWRWTLWLKGGLEGLAKHNPNVRIFEFQSVSSPSKTHSLLQNVKTHGIWKVYSGLKVTKVEGDLGEITGLTKGKYQTNCNNCDNGGIDFQTVGLRYLSDYGDSYINTLSEAYSLDNPADRNHKRSSNLSMNSLLVWLHLPNSSFWVNLNPSEPDRIIDATFGKTAAGRILLNADFQLKKCIAKFTNPNNSPTGKSFWNDIYTSVFKHSSIDLQHINGQLRLSIPTSFRLWIVPGITDVYSTDNDIFISKATLNVKMERDFLSSSSNKLEISDNRVGIDLDSIQIAADSLFKRWVLPSIIEAVNNDTLFAELREVYYSRIIAEWYKGNPSSTFAFSSIIDDGILDDCLSSEPWNPRTVFQQYVESIEKHEYNITEQSQFNVENGIVTMQRTYATGGVDFTHIPLNQIEKEALLGKIPNIENRIVTAFDSYSGISNNCSNLNTGGPGGGAGGNTWFGSFHYIDKEHSHGHGHMHSESDSTGQTNDDDCN
jgi:hypothetical protein